MRQTERQVTRVWISLSNVGKIWFILTRSSNQGFISWWQSKNSVVQFTTAVLGYWPHVYVSRVVSAAQQDVWRSVPQCHHLIRVGLCRDWLCSSQTWNTYTSELIVSDNWFLWKTPVPFHCYIFQYTTIHLQVKYIVNQLHLYGKKHEGQLYFLCRETSLSKFTHQSLPVWALLARWSAGSGVSGLGGELSCDGNTTNPAATGKERAAEKKKTVDLMMKS